MPCRAHNSMHRIIESSTARFLWTVLCESVTIWLQRWLGVRYSLRNSDKLASEDKWYCRPASLASNSLPSSQSISCFTISVSALAAPDFCGWQGKSTQAIQNTPWQCWEYAAKGKSVNHEWFRRRTLLRRLYSHKTLLAKCGLKQELCFAWWRTFERRLEFHQLTSGTSL